MQREPKYRMPVSPMTGKRMKMTEEEMKRLYGLRAEPSGGTVSFPLANRVLTATDYLEKRRAL
jgi:hypothetical protein